MKNGLCCICKNVLTSENACPSVIIRKTGYCRSCAKRRKGSGFCHGCSILFDSSNSNQSTIKSGKGYCRACENAEYKRRAPRIKELALAWAVSHPEKRKHIRMSSQRKSSCGISQSEFEKRFHAQNKLCAICRGLMVIGRPGVMNRACLDHDHKTGKHRNLLCASCNLLLGHCKEGVEILMSAIAYIQKHADGSSIQTVCDEAQAEPVSS
jgi:hypothetical protein